MASRTKPRFRLSPAFMNEGGSCRSGGRILRILWEERQSFHGTDRKNGPFEDRRASKAITTEYRVLPVIGSRKATLSRSIIGLPDKETPRFVPALMQQGAKQPQPPC